MYNRRCNIGEFPNQVLLYYIHQHFKDRVYKIELPFIYYFSENKNIYYDENFFADNLLYQNIEVFR